MILCFSGTGNSRSVADTLATLLDDTVSDITSVYGSIPGKKSRVIWVFPVYSWDVPPYMAKFIDGVSKEALAQATHYMVVTCGDDIGLTASSWRKLISAKEWNAAGTFSVQMPNNYVCLKGFDVDSPETESKKIAAMPERVAEIAAKIKKGFSGEDTVRGKFPWIKSRIIAPYFHRFLMNPSGFRVSHGKCVSCGMCATNCPLVNITLKDGRYPVWGNNCAFCLRCYHICPMHAVEYKNETVGKGQYILRTKR